MRRDPRRGPALLALVALALSTVVACGDGDGDGDGEDRLAERRAEVAERGADVMPFDLDATTHSFEPTATGLTETVTADDPADTDQIELIRGHLAHEADRFRSGDYGDPATIHGDDMPGLAELAAGAGSVTITLDRLAGGARLTFATDDAALLDALHRWGEAQTTDHGAHANHSDHPGS